MLSDASLSPQVSMTTFSVTKAQHLIFCWCFFFPSLSQRVPLDFNVFVAICCKLMPVSLYLSLFIYLFIFCLFGFVSLYLFCCVHFLYIIPFFCFFKFTAQFPPNCVCSFPALPPLLIYAAAYVYTSVYMWGSYRAEWHTTDTEPRQRRGDNLSQCDAASEHQE